MEARKFNGQPILRIPSSFKKKFVEGINRCESKYSWVPWFFIYFIIKRRESSRQSKKNYWDDRKGSPQGPLKDA